MNPAVFISCAVTGSADSAGKSPHVPVSPEQIASASLDAHQAGAAMVHIHVRDPATGVASRDPLLFREVVERIREKNSELIINLTGGMGGELVFGNARTPLDFHPSTDFVGPAERMAHITALRPDIGSLDCGSLNFDDALYGTTPTFLREMATGYKAAGVIPEIEVFELGHIELAKQLIAEGVIASPALFQLCLGIKYGAPATTEAMCAMRDALPAGAKWAAFGVGRFQMPMVAQAVLLGGNVRVGLEDNLYLEKGVLATNAQLVERAVKIVELMGSRVMDVHETRHSLGLPESNARTA
ncbi:3-keto-5-aminohexanoate cleavage protein [Paraburkholderia sp. UYCP14C]|uniref:3-keto-5-aminohexanoate cleavage protein n=1 Tax=Paraburkholderia sp. UYCP14C TaxID=2511130 RepID=UPI00101EF768|nr:3-keto-5-aminohexanoate cleavage protein [Paraburkholderia sp. UYCP14C]